MELQCTCGRWVAYPAAGEVVECECGTKFEVELPAYSPRRSMSIAGALNLHECGVFTVHDPTTGRLSGALEPERHGLPQWDDDEPPTPAIRERVGEHRGGYSIRVLVAAVAALAALAFALPAGASTTPPRDPCARVYPASPTVIDKGRPVPLHPVVVAYARCERALAIARAEAALEVVLGRPTCTLARPCR